jgi:hypothetical protein
MTDGAPDPERALQRALAEACWKADAGEAIAADLRGWLERHGVAEEDVEAVLAAPPRLGVYRSLVRNGLASVVVAMLPRTRARMNAASPPARFDHDLAAFVDEVGPRTHHLRDVPREFFTWAAPRWRADASLPAYLADLAAFELAHFAVAASPAARGPVPVDLALDRPLLFAPSARLLHLAWAVHELPAEPPAGDAPVARPVDLLAYRDAEHTVRWLDLTPLASSVIGRLLAGEALGAAVTAACASHGAAVGAALPDVARLLADLGARGVLLGGG